LAPFVKLKPPLFDNIIDLDGYLIRVEHEKVVFDEQWLGVCHFFLFSQKQSQNHQKPSRTNPSHKTLTVIISGSKF